jgi:integrative and conjugative element protein (TIGR02256 family)
MQSLYRFSCDNKHEVLASLIGYYTTDHKKAIVTGLICITSGVTDSVERDSKLMTHELAYLWKETNGRKFFLGEWHTHPENSNHPSALDIETAKDTVIQCPQFLMLISGIQGIGAHIVTADDMIELIQE